MRLKFKHFLQYMHDAERGQGDDSPLYIFDGSFAEKRGSRHMRRDYALPPFFSEDLMQFAGESRRPPYRCLVLRHTAGRDCQKPVQAPRAAMTAPQAHAGAEKMRAMLG